MPPDEIPTLLEGPVVSGRFFRAFLAAAKNTFGPAALVAIADVAAPHLRVAMLDEATDLPPVGVEHVQAFWHAVFAGPAQGDSARFEAFARRAATEGFGGSGAQVRLSALSPMKIAEFAASLWREDHGAGELVVTHQADSGATLVLSQHPFAVDPTSAMALAWFYLEGVASGHHADAATVQAQTAAAQLQMTFRWSPEVGGNTAPPASTSADEDKEA